MLSGMVSIESLEYVLPSTIVLSQQIEQELSNTMQRLKLPSGLIEVLTGIRERRIWDLSLKPSDVATRAAEKAIAAAGIDVSEIGCLINSSVSRDYLEPSVASLVHGNIKLSSECLSFDISNACLGFFNAMHILMLMIESGQIKYGLIVDGETSGELLSSTIDRLKKDDVTMKDYWAHFSGLTLGSGAFAAVLSHKNISRAGHIIDGLVNLADSRFSRLCYGLSNFMQADSLTIMNEGVKLAKRTWALAQNAFASWCDENISLYVPHQVGSKNIQLLNETLGLNETKQQIDYNTLGNTGPASVPISLKRALEAGRIKPKDQVALLGIGSGLNCSMVSLNW